MNTEDQKVHHDCYIALRATLDLVKASRPLDRTPLDRSYAVVITELEKIVAYHKVYIADAAVEA